MELNDKTKTELLDISRNLNLGLTFKNSRKEIERKIKNSITNKIFFNNSIFVNIEDPNQEACVKKFSDWQLGKTMEVGGFGHISEICKKNSDNSLNCNYVLKAQNITKNVFRKVFRREVQIFKDISGKNIGPELISDWYCKFKVNLPGYNMDEKEENGSYFQNHGFNPNIYIGYIIMDKWDGTLHDIVYEQDYSITQKQLDVLENLILRFHSTGWVHRDLKLSNILYKFIDSDSGKRIRLGITDFSVSIKAFSKDYSPYPVSLVEQLNIDKKYNLIEDYSTRPELDFLLIKSELKEYNINVTQFDKYIDKILKKE